MPDTAPRPGGTAYTATQLIDALRALGVRWVTDPENRPHGTTDDDIPELLGALLAAAESGIYCQALDQTPWITADWFSTTPANGRLLLLWRRTAQTTHDLAMGDTSPAATCAQVAARAAEHLLAIAAMAPHAGAAPTAEEQAAVVPLIRGARAAAGALPARIEALTTALTSEGYQV